MLVLINHMSELIIMGYFDDIQFLQADSYPHCRAVLDRTFPSTFSLEYLHTGRMFFGIDGGSQIILDRPAAFWHHHRHRYQYGAVDETGWHHHWVLMRGARARRIVEDGLLPLSEAGFVFIPQPEVFLELFRELIALVQEQDPLRHPSLVMKLEGLVAMITEWSTRNENPYGILSKVLALAATIRQSPNRDLDFETEASAMHVSYSHFRRLFNRAIGKSPYDYLLLCRMKRAAGELQRTNKQVKDIAYDAGYADPAQFSKLFKQKMGLSPQQFREALPPAQVQIIE